MSEGTSVLVPMVRGWQDSVYQGVDETQRKCVTPPYCSLGVCVGPTCVNTLHVYSTVIIQPADLYIDKYRHTLVETNKLAMQADILIDTCLQTHAAYLIFFLTEFDDYAEVRDPDKLMRSLGRPLSPRDIVLSEKIGEGQFGDVHKGVHPDVSFVVKPSKFLWIKICAST